VTPPDEVSEFGHEIAAVLSLTLTDAFIGAYFVGSIALGGYVRGESDIDIVGVCDEEVDEATRQAVIERVLELTPNCPARGLEFTLYRARVASSPRADTGFELNVNGGPRMPRSVHLSPHDEPRFWYVLDRAIAHRHGVAISGPPGREVFADVPRYVLLEVMGESIDGIVSTRRRACTRCSMPAAPGGSPSRMSSGPSWRVPGGRDHVGRRPRSSMLPLTSGMVVPRNSMPRRSTIS
jgi:predicted nucleotidyltransferase